MRTVVHAPGVVALVLCVGLVGGCNGSSSDSEPAAHGVKITEYVGDGHGGTKPLPSFLAGPPAAEQPVQTQSLATLLENSDPARASWVPRALVNWFAVERWTSGGTWIVTLQPTENEDSDLYLLERYGFEFGDGADCPAYSDRVPYGTNRDRIKGGYAPDWVGYYVEWTGQYPSCYVAVFGGDLGAATKRFTIEADVMGELVINGGSRAGSLPAGSSQWFGFVGLGGTHYTLILAALSGDPDVYIYQDQATEYVTGSAQRGGSAVAFVAPAFSFYTVRVYAYNDCRYAVRVQSP